ncbi:PREDICTED: glutathione S-transferase T3-like [Camelina sativa]|uniref:Glutathione S-transferase T3-like n=1 Tax=Camelina sativa TaxID=90675 RepID=A0ABM0XR32_CAMSA|nr:PREDICTED: glutathione S-transferase T3-like [Camelina sativa]
MDRSNPYSVPAPYFVDLLNSQQDSNTSETPHVPNTTETSQPTQFTTSFPSQPFQFLSQPVHFSSSIVPSECIDVSLDENEDEGGRESRKRWTTEEDVRLIGAWLNTSKDPVVSNEQRLGSFWKRVSDYYQASEGASGTNSRGLVQCKTRWNKINHQVNKFVGCYTQASARRKSGESEDDVLKVAYEMYMNDMKKPFMLAHCWRELKNDQKWNSEGGTSKKTKLDSERVYSSNSTNDGIEERPPGVKASKKKGKKAAMSNDGEDVSAVKLDRIIAMKEKEQQAKDRQGRMRLLESLLNNPNLTPAQVELRDKLTDQMLSHT